MTDETRPEDAPEAVQDHAETPPPADQDTAPDEGHGPTEPDTGDLSGEDQTDEDLPVLTEPTENPYTGHDPEVDR